MIKHKELTSHLSAAALSLLSALISTCIWWFASLPDSVLRLLTSPVHTGGTFAPDVTMAFGIVALFSLGVAMALQHFGCRRLLPLFTIGVAAIAISGLALFHFLAVDILAMPLVMSGMLSLALVQVNSLWYADWVLSNRLFGRVTITPLNGSNANERLASGLKLLQTVLPLQEAIVYECHDRKTLRPVSRLKTTKDDQSRSTRNSVWREGISLCRKALKSQRLVSEEANDDQSSIVAVPLTHEHESVGTLLLRLRSRFSDEDRPLLEAVGTQFARNIKRERVAKESSTAPALTFFSHEGALKKLDAAGVMTALLAEQRCEANALDIIDDGVAIAHLDGTLALANPSLLRFLEIEPDDVKRLDVFGLLNKLRTGVFDEPAIAVRRVLQSGIDYDSELWFEEKNQTIGLRISLLRENSAEPVGLAVYVRDLTRGKEYEKLKSDMISLMSHELRTPLTSINGFAELLTLDETIPAQAKEFVTIIANESQRLSRMINTFLAVTQLQRKDKQEVLKIPLRLDEVVRDTVSTLQPVAKKKRIRLVEQPTRRIPPVAADKSLITQVVKNLVHNAIKYSPERTTVTISTALEAEAVRVSVEDRGYGIPAEAKDRVWEKFYRVVRDGQEKDEESTGLGLSFVRQVVEQHGGCVDLKSEEGRGSTFSFTLPRL